MRRPPCTRARWFCCALALGALVVPQLAHADKFDETLDFSIHARATSLGNRSIGLRPLTSPPEDFGHARAYGKGFAVAPMLRANFSLHGIRFGAGAGFEGYRRLHVRYEARDSDLFDDGMAWGLPLEAFLGYAFRTGERVRPFLEARGTATFLWARGERNDRSGYVSMRGSAFGLAARAGVLVELNEYFFVDVGVGRFVLGPGTWTACVGLGIPIPLANL